jgi:hypothetical protein
VRTKSSKHADNLSVVYFILYTGYLSYVTTFGCLRGNSLQRSYSIILVRKQAVELVRAIFRSVSVRPVQD